MAFSREKDRKVYVQHLMADEAEELWRIMDQQKGYIFVCGGTLMGRDVRSALQEVIHKCGGLSVDESNKYLQRMQNEGRFVQELWS